MTQSFRLVLLGAPLLLAGCGEPEVTVYRLAKDTAAPRAEAAATATTTTATLPENHPPTSPAASAAPAPMAGTPVATAAGPGLAWTAPAGWSAKAGSAMRKGSYEITGAGTATADLSITAFPGDVGGEVANVNRWRGQLSLTPLPEADALAALTRLEAGPLKIGVVDLVGGSSEAPVRMLGAMVPFGGATWFFKLTGPDALVAQTKPAFLAFLQTVRPAAATP